MRISETVTKALYYFSIPDFQCNTGITVRNSSEEIKSIACQNHHSNNTPHPKLSEFMTTFNRSQQIFNKLENSHSINKRGVSDTNVIKSIKARGMREIRHKYPAAYKSVNAARRQLDRMCEVFSSRLESKKGQKAMSKTIMHFFGVTPPSNEYKLIETQLKTVLEKIPMSLHLFTGMLSKHIVIAELEDDILAAVKDDVLYLPPNVNEQDLFNETLWHELQHSRIIGMTDKYHPIGKNNDPRHNAREIRKLSQCKNHLEFAKMIINEHMTPFYKTELHLVLQAIGDEFAHLFCSDAQLNLRISGMINDANIFTDFTFHFYELLTKTKQQNAQH